MSMRVVLLFAVSVIGACECPSRPMFMTSRAAAEAEGARYRIELDCDGVMSRGVIEVFDVHHTTTEHHCFETVGSSCHFCSPRFEPACRGSYPGSIGKVRVLEGALPLVDGVFTALDGSMGSDIHLWLGSKGSSDKVCQVGGTMVIDRRDPTPCLVLPSREPSPTCRFTSYRVR